MSYNDGLERVCDCCKEKIYVTENNMNELVYYGGKTYHSKCFIPMCQKKISDKRCKKDKWIAALENIQEIQRSSYLHLMTLVYKDRVYRFICDHYGVTVIPTNVWNKISDIYSGKFRGMTVGIPPNDLLYMWDKKWNKLAKIADRNKTLGKEFTAAQRINYDLSVLVNSYDSYLSWKEKQKVLAVKETEEKEQQIVSNSNIYYAQKNVVTEQTNNISNLVDDIFG